MLIENYNQIHTRIDRIYNELQSCRLCPRRCGVDRTAGQKGFCGLDDKLYCFREMINDSEEPGLNPSHQLYFAGCNLRCGYCSVDEWNVQPSKVPVIDSDQLTFRVLERKRRGAVNLNLLGGEPAVSIYGILKLLVGISPDITVVWNSNMYFCAPVMDALSGLADIYLADFKCGNNDCSLRILGVGDYLDTVQDNMLRASRQGELIIRHVVMPGHIECCSKPLLEWISENLPDIKVSLRFNYIPPIPAGSCPDGYIEEDEKQEIADYSRQLELNII